MSKTNNDSIFVPLLPYQGVVKKTDGSLLANGDYEFIFSLYTAADGKKTTIWSEKQKIRLTDGILSVYLGLVNPLKIPFDKQYNLQIAVDNEVIDAGLLGASPYSFMSACLQSGAVNSLNGLTGKVEIKGDDNVLISKETSGELKISLALPQPVQQTAKKDTPGTWSYTTTTDQLSTPSNVNIGSNLSIARNANLPGTLTAGRISTGIVDGSSASFTKSITAGLVETDNLSTSLLTTTNARVNSLQFGNLEQNGKETIRTLNLGDPEAEPAMTLQYDGNGSFLDINSGTRTINHRGKQHNLYGPVKIFNNIDGGSPDPMLEVGGRLKVKNLDTPAGVRIPTFLATDGTTGYIFKAALPAQKWQGSSDIYYNSGKVGIGTNTPTASLTLAKASQATGGIMLTEDILGGAEERTEESKWQIRLQNPSGGMASIGSDIFGLQICKNNISKLFLNKDGYLGLGTDNPSQKLEVMGSVKAIDFKGNGANLTGIIKNINGMSGNINIIAGNNVTVTPSGSAGTLTINANSTADNLGNHTATQNLKLNGKWLSNDGGEEGVKVDNDGNVMIGRVTPYGSSKLSVDGGCRFNGEVYARKVYVNLNNWADYVFAPDYKLQPLHEVESFIKSNNHLPGIPSAKTVETEGLSVGDMQVLMMQKIEELTLHLIEQNKKIEQLEKDNQLLRSR